MTRTNGQGPAPCSPGRNAGSWKAGLSALVLQASQGDIKAFANLAERIEAPILRIIRKKVANPDEAGVLFNQFLFIVWEKSRQCRRESDLQTWAWLAMIAKNRVNGYLKVLIRARKHEDQESDLASDDGDGDPGSPLDRIEGQGPSVEKQVIQRLAFQNFIQFLGAQERLVFERMLAGDSQKEIAALIGLTPARICQIVREILARAEDEGLW